MLGILVAPSIAGAERLAIIKLSFSGAPPALVQQVRQGLRELFQRSKLEVIKREQFKDHPALSGACTVGPCLAALQRELNVDWALTASVVSNGSNYHVSLTLLETTGGTVLAQSDERCAVCTYADAAKLALKAGAAVVAGAHKTLREKAWLELRSDPKNARVDIDGVAMGMTPVKRLLAPGPHWVASFKGHKWIQQRVFLKAGSKKRVTLKLRAGGAAPSPPRIIKQPHWPAWLLGALGTGAASAGGVLWGLSGSCQNDCTTERRTVGITLIGAGAAAIGASILLLFYRESPKKMSTTKTSLHILPGSDRVDVGLTLSY